MLLAKILMTGIAASVISALNRTANITCYACGNNRALTKSEDDGGKSYTCTKCNRVWYRGPRRYK